MTLPNDDKRAGPSALMRDMRWVVGMSVVAAVALVLALPALRSSPSQVAVSLAVGLLYGLSIGGSIVLVLSRYGPWIRARRPPLNWLLLTASLAALTAVGTLAAGLALVVIGVSDSADFWPDFRRDIRYGWIVAVGIGVSISFYEKLRDRLETTRRELGKKELVAEQAEKLAMEARLSSLESRIHPHFLFNTLNSISGLIQEDPARAEKLVERLAALLRFSLDLEQKRTVPLEKELKITAGYLEIERARFGERLTFSIDAAEDTADFPVPPLAVQTLVENSLKHAVAPRREGGAITISAIRDRDRLRLEVADDGPGFSPEAMIAGHGLDTLRARLAAIYGDRAALAIEAHGRFKAVTISLPIIGEERDE